MEIGILVTATWKFIDFLPQLRESLNNFCPGHNKTLFVFTDSRDPLFGDVVKIFVDHVNFPQVTLDRYERYTLHRHLYEDMDYLFHIDADMTVISVGDEILNKLSAIKHPLFYSGGGSWEGRRESMAFVPEELRLTYYCGGIQGGTAKEYLRISELLCHRIQVDKRNDILADWHDESHWNWYLAHNPTEFTELDAGYCYPQEKAIPFERKIIALDKDRKIYRQ